MKRFSQVLVVTGLLSGCAIPADKPSLAPLAGNALGLAPGTDAPEIDAQWWQRFGDPQLDRIIADATAGSPSLSTAMARLSQAQAALESRRAEDGPDVTLDAQGQYGRLSGRYTIPPPYAGSKRFVGTAAENLNWNLDFFGRQRAAIEGARASARAASYDIVAAQLALTGTVTQTYIELGRAEAQAAIAARAIHVREESLRLVNARVRNKLASNVDVEAATTLLAQARQALVRAQGGRSLATNALAALAGRGPDYAAAITPSRLRLDGLSIPKTLPADLLARRPDVAAARARIDAAEAGRQVARRAFYPNINIAALAGFQAVGLGNLLSLDAGTAMAGPAIHLPLFDNGRLRAELAGATAGVDLATADYNERVVGAVREAADAVTRIAMLEQDRARQREIVKGFSETNRLNAIRISSGLETRLGLIETDVRTLEAEQGDANLAADAAIQTVALVIAMGGGFNPNQDVTQ